MDANEGCLKLYVSPEGNDAWSGRLLKPNADKTAGPLASFEAAQSAIRRLKRSGGLPKGGVTVWLAEGTYPRTRSFILTREDSGTPESRIVYRACPGKEARISGGKEVADFTRIKDPALLKRLVPEARKHVLQADLNAQGVRNFGEFRRRGFGISDVPAAIELFFDGKPMTVARWPDVDYVNISAIPKNSPKDDGRDTNIGKPDAGFYFRNKRINRWKTHCDIWVHGYWCWDWANSYEQVTSLDKKTGFIKTAKGKHYGYRVGQRFFFLNVLEELDHPGEWYLDRKSGILYFWPPAPVEEGHPVVSLLEDPIVVMKDVSCVTLQDIVFEYTRGSAIVMSGGAKNCIGGCTLRNIGTDAIVITGGTEHRVAGCEISHTGDSGISISGGDRKTLIPCNHVVENNHIHHFGRWSKTYHPAILMNGVGMRVAHNYIHDAPHTAILFSGNEFLVEYNEIHTVCMETGDAGAIYTGRDYTYRGNVVRYNFIHHMGGVGMGTMGIYNDDCVSGTKMIGNVFYRVTRAAKLGGGRDLVVRNNLFVDCDPAVQFDARGMDRHPGWHNMVYATMKQRLDAVNYKKPPYSTRYPELLHLEKYYRDDKGVPPENCVVEQNICVGGRWLDAQWGEPEHIRLLQQHKNVVLDRNPGFVKPASLDFKIADEAIMRKIGFKAIPFKQIGLCLNKDRSSAVKRKMVRVLLETVEERPSRRNGTCAPFRVRVVVENPGQAKATGKACLWISPSSNGMIIGTEAFTYSVMPGGKSSEEFVVGPAPGVDEVEVGVYLEDEGYVRRRICLWWQQEWIVRPVDFSVSADLEDIGKRLGRREFKRVMRGERCLAKIRIAPAGEGLAIIACVYDKRPFQAPVPWQGSCVEVFGSMPGSKGIGQVFLAPATRNMESRAYRQCGAVHELDSSIRLKTMPGSNGYEMVALIPYSALAIAPAAKKILLEIQVTVAEGKKHVCRATLFGSTTASDDNSRYGIVRVVKK